MPYPRPPRWRRLAALEKLLHHIQSRKLDIHFQLSHLKQAAAGNEAILRQLQENAHDSVFGVHRLIHSAHEVHLAYSCPQGSIQAVMNSAKAFAAAIRAQLKPFRPCIGAELYLTMMCKEQLNDIDDMVEQLENLRNELWWYTMEIVSRYQ